MQPPAFPPMPRPPGGYRPRGGTPSVSQPQSAVSTYWRWTVTGPSGTSYGGPDASYSSALSAACAYAQGLPPNGVSIIITKIVAPANAPGSPGPYDGVPPPPSVQ